MTSKSSTKLAKAKKAKAPKVKLPRLVTTRRLLAGTWREWRAHWLAYSKIIALIIFPSVIIAEYFVSAISPSMQANLAVSAILMNLAVSWAIAARHKSGHVPNVPQAYYSGTAAIVRYALLGLSIFVFLLPLSLGLGLYAIALIVAEVNGTFGFEQILAGVIALILAMPSIFLLIRYGFASQVMIYDDLRPMASLKAARRLTLGRFWPIAGRLAGLIVAIAISAIPIALITVGLSFIQVPNVVAVFLQTVYLTIVLAMLNIYIFRLYRWLADDYAGRTPTTAATTPADTSKKLD